MVWTPTPAHLAVEHEDLEALRRLLDSGADIQDPGEDGFTLLHHAIDIEADGATQTGEPLTVGITALLLSRGADPHAHTRDGLTPLDLAQRMRHTLAVELLHDLLMSAQKPEGSTS
ncbi:MAG TPA: ankyrin repeat domain-containing protein [Streptomyces sp.]